MCCRDTPKGRSVPVPLSLQIPLWLPISLRIKFSLPNMVPESYHAPACLMLFFTPLLDPCMACSSLCTPSLCSLCCSARMPFLPLFLLVVSYLSFHFQLKGYFLKTPPATSYPTDRKLVTFHLEMLPHLHQLQKSDLCRCCDKEL